MSVLGTRIIARFLEEFRIGAGRAGRSEGDSMSRGLCIPWELCATWDRVPAWQSGKNI